MTGARVITGTLGLLLALPVAVVADAPLVLGALIYGVGLFFGFAMARIVPRPQQVDPDGLERFR